MIMYAYDINAILAEPMKSRMAEEITRAYVKLFTYLKARGHTPRVHWLDNEAPEEVKRFNRAHLVNYQLVPPHVH